MFGLPAAPVLLGYAQGLVWYEACGSVLHPDECFTIDDWTIGRLPRAFAAGLAVPRLVKSIANPHGTWQGTAEISTPTGHQGRHKSSSVIECR